MLVVLVHKDIQIFQLELKHIATSQVVMASNTYHTTETD